MRKIFLAALTLGAIGAAGLPASAQVWGGVSAGFHIGHTPVGISVGSGPVAPAPVYPAYPAPYYAGPVYPAPAYAPPPAVFVNGYWRSPVWVGRPGYYHNHYYGHGYWRR